MRLTGLGEVAELPSGVFDGLPNLSQLWLESIGEVAELPSDVFDGLTSLEVLRLGGFEEVAELPSDLFDGLANLEHLDLWRFRRLAELPSGVFDGLGALKTLTIYASRLRSLDPEVFEGLSRLWSLDLPDNQLTTLHPNLFRGLDNLAVVDLTGNKLSTVDAGLFDGQRDEYGRSSMFRIVLSRNQLTRLAPSLLRGMEQLEILELQDNRLAAMPPRLFEGLYSLNALDLSGNPGAPFVFRPELVRIEGAADSGGAAEVALELPQGAAFDLRVGLSASGGALSADEAGVLIGQTRGGGGQARRRRPSDRPHDGGVRSAGVAMHGAGWLGATERQLLPEGGSHGHGRIPSPPRL